MDIKVTLTIVLSDEFWGFSDLLNGRELNKETKQEIIELIDEDIMKLSEYDNVQIEEYITP